MLVLKFSNMSDISTVLYWNSFLDFRRRGESNGGGYSTAMTDAAVIDLARERATMMIVITKS
jgi:hypothetical protein